MPSPTGLVTVTLSYTETFTSTATLGGTDTFTPTLTESPALITETTPTPTTGVVLSDAWCLPWNTPSVRAQVIRAIDGVTFDAITGDQTIRVRYIGIDLPELGSGVDTFTASFNRNKELVEGSTVLLIQDKSESDDGGDRPRYVIFNGTFVNLEMVESGYAVADSIPPDISCDHVFQQAEELARAAKRGLWAPTPTPTRTQPPPTATMARTGNVMITYIFEKGKKWQEPNEFVEIHNASDGPIQLQGWTLKDNENYVYVFPDYIMVPDQYCRVYTDEYHSSTCGFTYEHPAPIWDDVRDCAYLKDSQGILIDEFCYE